MISLNSPLSSSLRSHRLNASATGRSARRSSSSCATAAYSRRKRLIRFGVSAIRRLSNLRGELTVLIQKRASDGGELAHNSCGFLTHSDNGRAVPMDLEGGLILIDLVQHELALLVPQDVEAKRARLILETAVSVGQEQR